ncbi:MAG TPA: AAA family ATPase [Candidatus Binatia bacterium]|jgi:general secretion pathway protein A
MYNDYFGFRETPFNVTPNPKYFYSNPTYQEAYAILLYGVRERKGFIVLTGEVGTGKTTLLRKLMNGPEENVKIIFFYNTTLGFEELISFACDELSLPVIGSGRLQKIQALNEFLIAQSRRGGTVVLLVDEAQNLTDDVLENLRLLSNLETSSEKLLQIVLVGQTELDAKLSQTQLRQVKQRVALHCRLDRLKDREVGPFINYRLRMAGFEGDDLFTADAVREVASYSKGIPRLINIICDNALLIGYATSAKKISGDMIREAAGDLQLDDMDRRVGDGGSFAAKTITKDGKNEDKKRSNAGEEPAVRRLRNIKPVLVGSFAASILLAFLIGGVFFQPDFYAWFSDVVFSPWKPAKIQTTVRLETSGNSMEGAEDGKSPVASETALASARPVEAAASSNNEAQGQQKAQRSSVGYSVQSTEGMAGISDERRDRSVVIQRGNTISRIAGQIYGADRMVLGMDLLKEYNPRIEDLNWVFAGQQLSLPPLTRETLLRRQSDGSHHLILDSFFNAQEAAKLSQAVRLKGYAVAITPRKVFDNLMVHRVEIRGLKSLEDAYRAWEVATASRWIAVTDSSAYKENP